MKHQELRKQRGASIKMLGCQSLKRTRFRVKRGNLEKKPKMRTLNLCKISFTYRTDQRYRTSNSTSTSIHLEKRPA